MSDGQNNKNFADLLGFGEVGNSKLANKIYDDFFAPALKQLGKLGEDSVKAIRVVLFPLKLLAWGDDYLTDRLESLKVSRSSKEEDEVTSRPGLYVHDPRCDEVSDGSSEDERLANPIADA